MNQIEKEIRGDRVTHHDKLVNWVAKNPDAVGLIAQSQEFSEEDLKLLGTLQQLKCLDLSGGHITASGLQHLAGMPQLELLKLNECRGLTDSALEHLAGMSKLITLDLGRTGISDAALQHLAGLSSLRTLDLQACEVSDEGLAQLRNLRLRRLGLRGTQVRDAGLQYLSRMERLAQLDLGETRVSDTGLEHLTGLMWLRVLWLDGTQVKGEGLKKLEERREILIKVDQRMLIGAGHSHLKSMLLPDCRISTEKDLSF